MKENFNDFFNRASNYDGTGKLEYYEDKAAQYGYNPAPATPHFNPNDNALATPQSVSYSPRFEKFAKDAPPIQPETVNLGLQSFVVFSPRTINDVSNVIDYCRKRTAALVRFVVARDEDVAVFQRLLDFISGAIYALDGRVQPLGNDYYLLLPTGMEFKSEG